MGAAIGFTAPWLLLGLVALPLLWVLLRAVPPAPLRRRFAGIALLFGLRDEDSVADRTPWWLLLLRMMAMAALILGLAGPVLNPAPDAAPGSGPLLIVIDGTWADAPDWPTRVERARAESAGRTVAVALASAPPDQIAFAPAVQVLPRLDAMHPNPWGAQPWTVPDGAFDTLWISDGIAWPARADLARQLAARGSLRVIEPARPVHAITDVVAGDDLAVAVSSQAAQPGVVVQAIGPDPSGVSRVLATAPLEEGGARFDLPVELRNRVEMFTLAGARQAGAVWLAGADLRRREVALISGRSQGETAQLLSPLHYLRQALAPEAVLIEATLLDTLAAQPDVIILADVADLAGAERDALRDWIDSGGVLIRFAGPLTAAQEGGDDLMPVRLRRGGRALGGAMSWGDPRKMAPFDPGGPFAGLDVPGDVAIRAQVLAEPGPELDDRVLARLEDGTPLVTGQRIGAGQVVLFHVTANADWSDLPLSGVFPAMLMRLAQGAGARPDALRDLDPESQWQLSRALDVRGALASAPAAAPVPAARLAGAVGPDLPPGLYRSGDQVVAVNAGVPIAPAAWPAGVPVARGDDSPPRPLGGWLIAAALVLLALDVPVALALAGRLGVLALALVLPQPGQADDDFAIAASGAVHLAHVLSGDPEIDEVAAAGLFGLSSILFQRTAIEPGPAMGVDIETDELAFFPLLYWPVSESSPLPSPQAVARLNRYLRGGGMIVFDTRDGDSAALTDATPAQLRLRVITAALEIPPLEPVPEDHVLTRSFYLLDSFPGRYGDAPLWVEAAPPGVRDDGMPFRDGSDGVTPVVIASADFAGAWAMDRAGNRLLPVGRGRAGERQRELAYRVGVNLAMYVLTGNYKSDQVHVPALLDRLGER